ncbi:hypothetical protein SAMN05720354_1221, partial [Nitrosospira sp. Nsp1]
MYLGILAGMEITQAQYERIVHCLPLQRGN